MMYQTELHQASTAAASTAGPQIHFVDLHVGQRVREFRKQRKLSQTKLGERLGVSFQQIQKYEKGINRISASVMYQLAVALECEIADFYRGLPVAPAAEAETCEHVLKRLRSTAGGLELAQTFLQIREPCIREQIVSMIRTFQAVEGRGRSTRRSGSPRAAS